MVTSGGCAVTRWWLCGGSGDSSDTCGDVDVSGSGDSSDTCDGMDGGSDDSNDIYGKVDADFYRGSDCDGGVGG